MMVKEVVVLLLGLALHLVIAEPYIRHLSPAQYKEEGDRLDLECTVDDAEEDAVAFVKVTPRREADNTLISLEDALLVNDPRLHISVVENGRSATYRLTIENAEVGDTGTYRCQVLLSLTRTIHKDSQVQVRRSRSQRPYPSYIRPVARPAQITYITPHQRKSEGESVELSCTVSNPENYPVVWTGYSPLTGSIPISVNGVLRIRDPTYRANYYPYNSTHTLRIDRLDETDEGEYRCEIMTSITNKVTKSVRLDVEEDLGQQLIEALQEVIPRITYHTPSQHKQVGEEVVLSCTIENVDIEPVFWMRGSEVIASKDAVLIHDPRYSASYDDDRSTYYLRIISLKHDDAGTYTCTVFDPEDDDALSEKMQVTVAGGNNRKPYPYTSRPEITYITQRQYRYEGDEVALTCTVRNVGDHPVQWMKNGNSLISTDDDLMTFDSRYSVQVDEALSTYSLRIRNVREDDSGAYTCEVLLNPDRPDDKVSQRVDLQVQRSNVVPPGQQGRPYIASISPAQVKNEGDSVLLECVAQNVKDFPVLWIKDMQILGETVSIPISDEDDLLFPDSRYSIRVDEPSSTYYLRIDRLQSEDAGEYNCVIMTSFTDKIAKGVRLDVRDRGLSLPQFTGRRPRIVEVSPSEVKRVGDSVSLTCRVENAHIYPVLWIKDDDKAISSDDHLLVRDRKYSVTKYGDTFTLAIRGLDEHDTGTYACVVMVSLLDYDSKDVRLDVRRSGGTAVAPYGRPSIRYVSPQQTRNAGDQAVFSCIIDNKGDHTLLWKRDNSLLATDDLIIHFDPRYRAEIDQVSNTYFLKIEDLRRDDAGTYTCEIQDTGERKTASLQVIDSYHIPPRDPERASGRPYISQISERQTKNEGDSVVLTCRAENVGSYPVLWAKTIEILGDQVSIPITAEDEVVLPDTRYSVYKRPINAQSATYELRIDRLEEDDSGTYECQIFVSLIDKLTRPTQLDVRRSQGYRRPARPQTIPEITYVSPAVYVGPRETISLRCTVRDAGDSPVLWIKDDEHTLAYGDHLLTADPRYHASQSGETFYLEVRDAVQSDAGIFTCVVMQSLFSYDAEDIQVGVAKRPPTRPPTRPPQYPVPGRQDVAPTMVVPEHTVYADVYSTEYLNCTASGYPIPRIIWYKDSRPIAESGKYHVDEQQLSEGYYKSTLAIRQIQSSDYGRYTCLASNRVGSNQAFVNLNGGGSTNPSHPAPLTKPCDIDENFITTLADRVADQVTRKVLENLQELDNDYDKLETILNELRREYQSIGPELKRYYR